jgi:hypothetical protein
MNAAVYPPPYAFMRLYSVVDAALVESYQQEETELV